METVSWEKYGDLINAIREIYVKHGAELFHTPGEMSATMNQFYPSQNGETWLVFYWGSLTDIRTPDGSHPVMGSRMSGDNAAALTELQEQYGLELIETKERDYQRWDYYKVTCNV